MNTKKWTKERIEDLVGKFITKYSDPLIQMVPTKSMFRYQSGMSKMMLSNARHDPETAEIIETLDTFILMMNEQAMINGDFKQGQNIHRYMCAAFKDEGYNSAVQIEQMTPSIVINTNGLSNSIDEKDNNTIQ